jgi:hypothetical protein
MPDELSELRQFSDVLLSVTSKRFTKLLPADLVGEITKGLPVKLVDEIKGAVVVETSTRVVLYAYEMLARGLDQQGAADLTCRVIKSLQDRMASLEGKRDLAEAGLNPSQLKKYKDRPDKSESAVKFLERVYQPSKQKIEQGLIRKYDKPLYEALHNWVQHINRRKGSDSDSLSVKDLTSGNPIPDDFKAILDVEGRKGSRGRRAQTTTETSNRRKMTAQARTEKAGASNARLTSQK